MSFRPRRGFPDEMDAALNRRWVTADTPPTDAVSRDAGRPRRGVEKILRPEERIFFFEKGSETRIIQDSPVLPQRGLVDSKIFQFLVPVKTSHEDARLDGWHLVADVAWLA